MPVRPARFALRDRAGRLLARVGPCRCDSGRPL